MPDIIKPICIAIMDYWKALTPSERWDGELYFGKVPQGTKGCWATFNYDSGVKDEIQGSVDAGIENAEIRFNLFNDLNDGGFAVLDMQKKLTDAFDWATLTVSGYQCVKMQRTSIGSLIEFDGIWQIPVIYEISIG